MTEEHGLPLVCYSYVLLLLFFFVSQKGSAGDLVVACINVCIWLNPPLRFLPPSPQYIIKPPCSRYIYYSLHCVSLYIIIMYAVLILSPLPSVIPFGGEKKRKWNTTQEKKKEKKFERLGSFEIRAPADCGCIELYTVGSLSLSLLIHNWRCIIKLTRLPVCQICNFSTKRKKGKSQDHHHHQPVRQWSGNYDYRITEHCR
jgi:hypothetical protein